MPMSRRLGYTVYVAFTGTQADFVEQCRKNFPSNNENSVDFTAGTGILMAYTINIAGYAMAE